MCHINKAQKNRENFLYTLLEYDSSQEEFNPHFYKGEMLELLGVDESKFNKIQKCLGDQYCSHAGQIKGKDRYQIHTSNCWLLHDKFEDWKLNKKLKNLTITLMFIAILTIILSMPQAVETTRKLWPEITFLDCNVEKSTSINNCKKTNKNSENVTSESEMRAREKTQK